MNNWKKFLSYSLVAILASALTVVALEFRVPEKSEVAKLEELNDLIEEKFIGEYDEQILLDSAAAGMVASLDDEWSYYMSAQEYAAYQDTMNNAYVGVGITITVREDGYLDVMKVEPKGPAKEAGIQPGDVLIKANGLDCAEMGIDQTGNVVRGEEGTTVNLTVLRDGRELEFTVERRYFEVMVAEGKMLPGSVGLVTIMNFDTRCAEETLAAVKALMDQGARALIFDVRNNPGGYKHELVEILDYLLPEGVLFRSEFYDGTVTEDKSDKRRLEIPMAVLVNGESYSAAEFFAAALMDYDAAVIVGTQTYGKGYFQQTFTLQDGSAVGLSVGKYYTPIGENLAGVGITPDIVVDVEEEVFLDIYYGRLEPMEDPQVKAALEALKAS